MPDEYPNVDKQSALSILAEAGEGGMDVEGFAQTLRDEGFRVPGPRKAYNTLNRLKSQGLVRKDERTEELEYTLGDTNVSRTQRRVYWVLTERGLGRLEWLRNRPEPPPE